MASEKWPEPNNQNGYEPDTNPIPNQAYPGPEVIEPARPEAGGFKNKIQGWGTDFAKDQARDFALGKAVDLATKIPMAGRVFVFTRWFFYAEWGAIAVAVVFAVLGIIGLFQHDTILSIFVLVLAAIAFGIFWVVRKIRLFVERQIEKAFRKFEELVRRGVERPDDWSNWYRQNKQRV